MPLQILFNTAGMVALATRIWQKEIKGQIAQEEIKVEEINVVLTDMTINIENSKESTTRTNYLV